MSLRIGLLVRSVALLAALAYLFLNMEWSEDRLIPAASSSTLPTYVALQEARAPVIATKVTAPAAPSEIARASPLVVPTAISDCPMISPEPAATIGKAVAKARGKSVAKAKRTAKTPIKTMPTKMPESLQVAAAGRGSKEAKY
jgi:hypothetical protein